MPKHWTDLLPKVKILIVSVTDPSISTQLGSTKDGGPEWLIHKVTRPTGRFAGYKAYIAENIAPLGMEAFQRAMVVRLCERIAERSYIVGTYEKIVARHGAQSYSQRRYG